jgi:hypothetical protein
LTGVCIEEVIIVILATHYEGESGIFKVEVKVFVENLMFTRIVIERAHSRAQGEAVVI